MFLLFHGCKSDICIEVSGSISSITSCRTPTTVRKVHNLNPKPIVVKVINAMPIPLPKNAIDIGIILMTMILRRTSASNTIPTIKAKQLCFALWSQKAKKLGKNGESCYGPKEVEKHCKRVLVGPQWQLWQAKYYFLMGRGFCLNSTLQQYR